MNLIEFGISDERRRKIMLTVGSHRSDRPLSPMEVAETLEQVFLAGATHAQIASALYLEDSTMVGRFRHLLRLPPGVRHLVVWGRGNASISMSVGSEITRLENNEEIENLCELALEQVLTKVEVRQIVELVLRGSSSVQSATKQIVQLRPEIVRRFLFVGGVTDSSVEARISSMLQSDRDLLLEGALRNHHNLMGRWEGHLGIRRFTLVGDRLFSVSVEEIQGGFEEAINSSLKAEIDGH